MDIKGQRIKVVMPDHFYDALQQEAKDAAVTMADLVRLAMAARYKHKQQMEMAPREVT